MRSKCIAALIAFCFLGALVSAQPYSVRANRGLNLRAAPSLNADIAETVSAGALLQVVGKFNRWLKVNLYGKEVWLADWVNYSRVESGTTEQTGSQPVSSTPANVDNCCGIDRQCSSDQEWTNGYWAFQNGQCAAPAPPQPQTSAAPVGNVPANVDNCCYLDRQCNTDLEWMAGWQAYRNGQCAGSAYAQRVASAPATGGNCCSLGWTCAPNWKGGVELEQGYWAYQINQCAGLPETSAVTLTGPVPRIEGSSRFVQHITETLKFMKSVAPAWYNYVITGMDSIVEVHVPGWKFGDSCTARAYDRERRVTLESCWAIYAESEEELGIPKGGQVSTAAALGHEACHIHTHEEGKHFASQEDEEAECRKFGGGAIVLLNTALATGLGPMSGTHYFHQESARSALRRFCSEGYRADLFCPTLHRMEDIWRNVPYAVFPPGEPEDEF